jgi:transcription antitermination factor NusG|tara:strand:- start:3627 stop:4103 length:477 start_codon:yes stop_codon:yes gene_type:complete
MSQIENHWFVVVTKPQNEKKVELQLNQIGIPAYCPVRTEIRQWSDRAKKIKVPLLPSMLLVKIPNNLRNIVFDFPGVRRYLYWQGKPAIVKEHEVEVLRQVSGSNFKSAKLHKLRAGSKLDLSTFGIPYSNGTVKYTSGNQCWVVIDSLGYVLKLQLS